MVNSVFVHNVTLYQVYNNFMLYYRIVRLHTIGTVLYCTVLYNVLYSIKLNWRQWKVVFRVGNRNTNCDIQQQSNAIKKLCFVYEITVLYTW